MVAAAPTAHSAPSTVRYAIVSPLVDLLCVGGLSLLICVPLLLFGTVPFDRQVPALFTYILTAAITWPHFLASYRLLYSSRTTVTEHPIASLYFPLALIAYSIFALTRVPDPLHVQLLSLLAALYLARHYTGQTWGMMASFSFVGKTPFAPEERRICQLALHLIMAWHLTWALAQGIGSIAPNLAPLARQVNSYVDVIAIISFLLGGYGLFIFSRRIGRLPDIRIVVPWLALYGWYALLRKDPTTLVVVQLSHALQYLIFPLRIEQNRSVNAQTEPRLTAARSSAWLFKLTAISIAVFAGIPWLFTLAYHDAGGIGELSIAFTSVFISFVNIHHYFVDGVLYKLRNPAVRRDLFAHITSNKAAA
jgi:hypothetical protein